MNTFAQLHNGQKDQAVRAAIAETIKRADDAGIDLADSDLGLVAHNILALELHFDASSEGRWSRYVSGICQQREETGEAHVNGHWGQFPVPVQEAALALADRFEAALGGPWVQQTAPHRRRPMIQIRFWWPSYSPDEAFESFNPAVTEMAFEVSRDGGRTWRSPLNGATLQTVYDWMVDKSLGVADTALVRQRRQGKWEGQYVLTIGPVN